MTNRQASIVIPTHQRRASVERALKSLCRQTAPHDSYEVVVSIDGSDDGTAEMVAGFEAPYRLQAVSHTHSGRAATCNAGIRAARGRLIVLLDDDMEASPELVAAHVDAHHARARRAVVGAAPIVVSADASPLVRYRARGFNGRLARFATSSRRLSFRETYTGNFSISRKVFLAAGGFDERFTLYGHEDYELALRLVKADVELVYSPAAIAWQHYEKDFAALARDCIERGHTAALFAAKHPDAAPFLEICGYKRPSGRRRLVRAALLSMSRMAASTPERVVSIVEWLERRQPGSLHRCYELSLDYFYWLGVTRARAAGHGLGPTEAHAR